MAALHVGSERLLAGFDGVSGVPHALRLEGSADYLNKNPSSSHGNPCTRDMFFHLKRREKSVVVLHIYRLCCELI